MRTLVQCFLVFAACAGFDFAYIAWLRAERECRLVAVTAWAPVVAGISLFGVVSAVHSQVLVIPYLAGQAFGSWLSVWLRTRRAAAAGTER